MSDARLYIVAHVVVVVGILVRVMLRPYREPAARIAWIAVVAALPVVGIFAYLLFGEVDIGARRARRRREVGSRLVPLAVDRAGLPLSEAPIPDRFAGLFRLGHTISGFEPVGGNSGRLLADSNAAIDAMVTEIDAARSCVHVLFYIWLDDGNGRKFRDALIRAAQRGVDCRVLVDDLGSRSFIRSDSWRALKEAGVAVGVCLPIGSILLRPLRILWQRVDLRDHRKIVVVDGRITFCGSQNCADPEFRVKPRYAPWVDAVMRFEGPIARQNDLVFASDWASYTNEDPGGFLPSADFSSATGFPAQVIATGPTARPSAMTETFEALFYAARRELVISTPYFVPGDSLLQALCSAAWRGVDTTLIVPERNDSFLVAGASRSCYARLLEAGVKVFEYRGGLLHTKSLTVDGEVSLIGSANMDRRSFDLNYENNILFHDPDLTADFRMRQQDYIDRSKSVDLTSVAAWTPLRRLWNNTLALLAPII